MSDEALKIVRELAELGCPTILAELGCAICCHLCGADFPHPPHEPSETLQEREHAVEEDLAWHDASCLWRRAREVVGGDTETQP